MLKIETHIAWRYLIAKKRQNAINIISGVSCLAVAVVTAAMICVLSVMNGFGEAVERMFSQLDAELRITPAEGKTIHLGDERIRALYSLEGIELIAPTIEETAIVEFRGRQVPAMLKGVDTTYQQLTSIDSIIIDGNYAVWDGAFERCVMGVGLANTVGIGAHFISPVHLYAPKRAGTINMLRPDENFHTKGIFIAGVFAVNQTKYDDTYMLISLPLARELFEYDDNQASALELKLQDGCSVKKVQKQIRALLGTDYAVLNRYEQQEDFYRIQMIEKWLTALLLVFILIIASFNIISSLSMLILDKKDDIRLLHTLGADERMIKRIFLLEGWLISALGAFIGTIIGVLVCGVQQHFGLLKLGNGTNYVLSAYPVSVYAPDVLLVLVVVLLLGALTAWIPARKLSLSVIIIGCLATGLTSCRQPVTPIHYQTLDSVLTSGRLEYYGQFYQAEGIDYGVVCLDLYSKGLGLNKEGRMEGVGTNLYIGDIFLSTATPTAVKAKVFGKMTVTYIGDTLVLDGIATLKGQKAAYPFHYRDVLPVIRRD